MKKLVLILLLSAIHISGWSQKVYFLYFQSESGQSFYLKMGEKVYSSTASGYLILSKLHDSTYNFNIGFAGGKGAEQPFTVTLKGKDHGYLLKDFGAKGLGLFDLQTMAVTMNNGGVSVIETPKTDNKDVSAFTDILSKAADDPSLKEKAVVAVNEEKKTDVKKEEPKKEETKVAVVEKPKQEEVAKTEIKEQITTVQPTRNEETKTVTPSVNKDTVTANEEVKETKDPVVAITKTEEVIPLQQEEFTKSIVTRRSESSTTEGFGLVFTDDNGKGNIDTIRIMIPEPKVVAVVMKEPVKEEVKEEKKFLDMPADTIRKVVETKQPLQAKQEENKIADNKIAENNIDSSKSPEIKQDEKKVATEPVAIKCASKADKDDFFKLRKKMASVASNDEMIDEARQYFKQKCFTTEQVKNLGSLFLDDEGKYRFYDLAYTNVSDPEKFGSLESELKDQYFIGRFKAMIR